MHAPITVNAVRLAPPHHRALAFVDITLRGLDVRGAEVIPGPYSPRVVFPRFARKSSKVRFEDRGLWDAASSEAVKAIEATAGRRVSELMREKSNASA
jgi:hypothetical protein